MNIVLDLEGQGLKIHHQINFVGIYTEERTGEEEFWWFQIPEQVEELRKHIDWLNSLGAKWCGHNIKFDAVRLLYQYGIDLVITNDTQLLDYLMTRVDQIKDNQQKWLGLKYAAPRILGVPDWDIPLKQKMSRDPALVIPYLKLDCVNCYRILKYYKKNFTRSKLYTYKLLIHASNAYKYIENNGLPIDVDMLRKTLAEVSAEYQASLDFLRNNFADINYNSPNQLCKLLFDDLQLPILSYTKKGKPSTDYDSLLSLRDMHPIIKALMENRELEKTHSFLVQWDENKILHKDGYYYLHSSFNLHGTVTGRTSSSGINLQQIPRNKKLKQIFRSMDPEWEFVSCDFSQMELRFAAVVANISAMKKSYKNKEDLHIKMAAIVSNKNVAEVTKAERNGAKAINFGYLYKMQAPSFQEYAFTTYGVEFSLEEATRIRNQYFIEYPELEEYYYLTEDQIMSTGKLTSIMGREYEVSIMKFANYKSRGEYLRAAINFPVQSPASDYVVSGVIDVMADPKLKGRVRGCATVHDSFITLIKKDEQFADTVRHVVKTMENSQLAKQLLRVPFDIPIVVEEELGPYGLGVSLQEYMEKRQ